MFYVVSDSYKEKLQLAITPQPTVALSSESQAIYLLLLYLLPKELEATSGREQRAGTQWGAGNEETKRDPDIWSPVHLKPQTLARENCSRL